MTSEPLDQAEMRDASAVEGVLIAGGGIGGLATALALSKRGIASTVLERRWVFGDDGAGIQIGPNGTRILEQLGAAQYLRARAMTPDALRVLDAANANQLATFPLGRWMAARHGSPYWVAHRRDVHSALVSAAEREPLITIKMGFGVGVVKDKEKRVFAQGPDGELVSGEALIAADGAWSALRLRTFGGGLPNFTGKTAARAVIPIDDVPEALHRTEVHLWLGPDVHVVHYPVSSGHAVAIVAIFNDARIANDWSTPRDRSWMTARTKTFAPLLRDLLARPEQWRSWPLLALPKRPKFAVGRTALLGDAAHPVLPFLAQGGVMALEDAMVIAHAVSAHPGDPARAFKVYEKKRRARVGRVARASRMNGRIYHFGAPLAAARNYALAHMPPERFMSRYDWLYGWKPPASD
jgi:salicylate hydroxylase